MDRLMMFLTNNASIQEVLLFPQMRPEKKQIQIELEADEKVIVAILQANDNQMEFGLLKIKSDLSGKKWDKAMKNLSSLGMTEVVVAGDVKACRLKG
jgi:lysyl-tRNA synthetase class 2